MAVVILAILLIGLLLIATESSTHINKAAVAMFAGVTCWLIFIAGGNQLVSSEHAADYAAYLSTADPSSPRMALKEYISNHIFLTYVAKSANIVLFLLATTTIVEVLSQNGCFYFMAEWLRTRRPRKLMWLLALLTFVLSANLDNLVTVVLLLSIIHPLLRSDKLRRIYGTVIILAANCGGVITVIGDLTSLELWTEGLVTPSPYFLSLVGPVVVALGVMLWFLQRNLPGRVEFATTVLPYRGDDTILNRWQRLLMLFVGVGGLWFIPTFHRLTALPPFVGALCVLALLWFVNELCNRQLLRSDKMVGKRLPMALQYANLQNLLYFIGLMLMFGALVETGLPAQLYGWLAAEGISIACPLGALTVLSAFLGNVPVLLGGVSFFSHPELGVQMAGTGSGGLFWPMLSYVTALGGTMLSTGTIAGLLLMRMEGVGFGWYFKHVTPKVLAGFVAGLAVWVVIIFCGYAG